jgi:hypothetical protein
MWLAMPGMFGSMTVLSTSARYDAAAELSPGAVERTFIRLDEMFIFI